MSAIDPRRGYPAPSGDLSDLPAVPSGPGPGSADVDPFPLTPPSPEESAYVAEGAALLTAAADRLDLMHCEGSPIPWLPELVAVLLAAAQQAVEGLGADRHAVALARKVMGEGEST